MATGLNIAALTRRTGVPSDTIRKWEQRYGVLRPDRTAGGQRRYTDRDVARVEWLKARLSEGYRIGEAAAMLGTFDVAPPRSPAEQRRALLAATDESDVEAIGLLVDQALTLGPVEQAFEDVLTPVLVEVGERWEAGDLSIAQEHLVSGVVRAGLERLLVDTRPMVRGVAVLACAPGERHEIALLMLAVLLRADGWNVAYLGPDTPLDDAVALAAELPAQVLCLSATLPDTADALARALPEHDLPSDLSLVAGGHGLQPALAAGAGILRGPDRLADAVAAVRALEPRPS